VTFPLYGRQIAVTARAIILNVGMVGDIADAVFHAIFRVNRFRGFRTPAPH